MLQQIQQMASQYLDADFASNAIHFGMSASVGQALPFCAALQNVGHSGYPDCVRAFGDELATVLHHCRQSSLMHELQGTAHQNTCDEHMCHEPYFLAEVHICLECSDYECSQGKLHFTCKGQGISPCLFMKAKSSACKGAHVQQWPTLSW